MQQLETRMAAEKARIAEFSQAKQDELSQRLQQATLDVQNAEADLKQVETLVLDKRMRPAVCTHKVKRPTARSRLRKSL